MALDSEQMKNDIITALSNGADSAINANKKLGDAVLAHICSNIQVTYSWSGAVNPSGSTDPVTTFVADVSGSGTLEPSSSFDEFISELSALIKDLSITPPPGFALAPLLFNPNGEITAVQSGKKTQDEAIVDLCDKIIDSLKSSFVNSAPSSGGHLAFVGGVAIMTSIQ